jgi:hypothetical protein
MRAQSLHDDAAAAGLAWRGALALQPEDGLGDGTLVLLGFAGGLGWPAFAASPEALDGARDPLERWSRRVIDALAARWGGLAVYPMDGPPYRPFQRWALRAEPVHPSPLGLLIHPEWGLWHSYRGGVALPEALALPDVPRAASPCETCEGRPCLTTCPVGAFTPGHYDTRVCVAHLAAPEGADCMDAGCRARLACPVGAAYRYTAAQAQFHMRAFRSALLSR